MSEFLNVMIPLMAAMLSPIWLPLVGVALGRMLDGVRPQPVTPAQAAVDAAKARSLELRATRPLQKVSTRSVSVAPADIAA